MAIRTENITLAQSEKFKADAEALESFIMGPLATVLKERWYSYHRLLPLAKWAGYSAADVLGAELAEENRILNEKTRKIANMVKALNAGKAVICWTQETKDSPVVMSVAKADRIPGKLSGWPLVVLIVLGIGAATAGVLYLWNAGPKMKNLFSDAEETKAKNESRILAIAEQLPPDAKAKVLGELAEARKKAAETEAEDFFNSIGKGIGGAVGGGALLLLAFLFFSSRKK